MKSVFYVSSGLVVFYLHSTFSQQIYYFLIWIEYVRLSWTHSSFPEQAGRGVRGLLAHTGGNSVQKDLLVEKAPGEPVHVKEGGR